MDSYLEVLRKYAVFSGRASRREYWMFLLFNVLIALGLLLAEVRFGIDILFGLYSLAVLLPSVAVAVRRLHDAGHSGTWLVIGFLPVIGALVLIFLLIQGSQPGDNEYGPSPARS